MYLIIVGRDEGELLIHLMFKVKSGAQLHVLLKSRKIDLFPQPTFCFDSSNAVAFFSSNRSACLLM